jgi:polar amino acid transport system ATP-binding protein
MLRINKVVKKYKDKIILDHVTLNAMPGSIIILLGASGVGKSTLLRVLNDLETIDAGSIILDNVAKQDIKNHSFGMVFQNFNLFEHLTVEHNIMIALEKVLHYTTNHARHVAHELLQQYGLLDKAHAYPTQLSGGQKQRLAIARAVALKPRVICMDEPTSALDPLLTNSVAQAIQDLAVQGFIVLVATHDTGLLDKLDATICLMQHGAIVETASTQDFRAHKEKFPHIAQFVAGT